MDPHDEPKDRSGGGGAMQARGFWERDGKDILKEVSTALGDFQI